jgi:hypothetical protein
MPKFFKIELRDESNAQAKRTILYNVNSIYKIESSYNEFNGDMMSIHFYDNITLRYKLKVEDFLSQLKAFEASNSDFMLLPASQ